MRTTLLSQNARDDACQILGFAANQGAFHSTVDAFDGGFVLRRMSEVLNGNPSDDAACGGCRCMMFLLTWKKGVRVPTLRAEDLHDVLIPVWLHKDDAGKDAAGKALRVVLSNKEWMDANSDYFQARVAPSRS